MKKMPKIHLAAAACAFLALGSCNRAPPDGAVRVSDPWVRLPAAKGQPGSAYFRLEAGSEGTRLTGLSSSLVRRIELHETQMKGNVARMELKKEVEFPFDGKLVFEPGGRHAMLFGIDKSVVAGSKIPLTFSFNVAPPVTLDAEVRALGDGPHEGH